MYTCTILRSSASKNNHVSSDKNSLMLEYANRVFSVGLAWCFDPFPCSISMPSKTPSVIKSSLTICSSTEDNHHPIGHPFGA